MNQLNGHKGTYRNERFPKALRPDYFKLDDRSDKELIAQTAELASYIKYYNEQNELDGNWEAFFEEVYDYASDKVNFQKVEEWEKSKQAPPHLALFLAFAKVFNIAQDELNRLSQRHLEYYYNNILKFERNKAVEDKVALFFEMDKKAAIARVPKGTRFDGGNDNNGKKRLYVSDYDVVVNKTEIKQVKTLIFNKKSFGKATFDVQEDLLTDTPKQPSEVGIAISSPMFYLTDGERIIRLFLKDEYKAYVSWIKENVKVFYTAETGWNDVRDLSFSTLGNELCLNLTIPKYVSSFVRYDEGLHRLHIKAKDPVLRFVFSEIFFPENTHNESDFLAALSSDIFEKITVEVSGSKDLLLYNDYGKLNGNVAFMPFGPNPVPGSNRFYIGNNRIFNKYLLGNTFSIIADWKGLPSNIEEYYSSYDKAWKLLDATQQAIFKFDPKFASYNKNAILKCTRCLDQGEWNDGLYFDSDADAIRMAITEFNAQTKTGFVQVDLNVDFGHSVYNTLLSRVLMENVQKKEQYAVPEKPYTPEIQELSVNYTLQDVENEYQLFSLHPFVNREVPEDDVLFPILTDSELVNDVTMKHSQCHYIALANVNPQDEVNVYFDLSNDIPYQDNQYFLWGYYDGQRWLHLEEKLIVRDTTNIFRQSGIITFIMPEEMHFDEDGRFWLCLSMVGEGTSFPGIRKVRAHCVIATFQNQDNELSHLKLGLPAFSIQKMEVRNNDIKTVEQPFPSFDGKEEENDEDFYSRISERLRHKNRASSAWDYEHLVLETFPQISFVLCLGHSQIEQGKLNYAPGCVTLLVSPDTEMLPQDNPLEPKVPEQLLTQIRDYVKTITSPHVSVSVSNFVYKEVKVHCEVQLKKGCHDTSFYHDKLNADLVNFMSPWTVEDKETERGGWMYQSRNVADLYFFLENLEYIDFVINAFITKDGEVYSIADKSLSDDECGIGKKPFEIFTSDTNHDIRIVYNE